jgi:hypothetical protein
MSAPSAKRLRSHAGARIVKRKDGSLAVPPDDKHCNALKRRGGLCQQPPGFKTPHPGVGRCKFHGGCTPVKHGASSSVYALRPTIGEAVERFLALENPLDLSSELATMRALAEDFINRYQEWRDALLAWHASYLTDKATAKPREILDVADGHRIIAEVGKMVERIEKIRAENAISWPRLTTLSGEMYRVVERYVMDRTLSPEQQCQGIRDGWLNIHV